MSEYSTLDRDAPRDAVTGLPAIETVRGRIGDWLAQAADGGEPARGGHHIGPGLIRLIEHLLPSRGHASTGAACL